LLKITLAVALIVWLVGSGKLDFTILFGDPGNILHLVGCLAIFLNVLLQVVRWVWLLEAQDIEIGLGRAVEVTWIANFFALALPGVVGGDAVRAFYLLGDAKKTKLAGVSTVLVDRIIGVYSLFWIGGFVSAWILISSTEVPAILADIAHVNLLILLGSTLLLTAGLCLPLELLRKGLRHLPFAESLAETVTAYKRRKRILLRCFFVSLVGNMLDTATYFLAALVLRNPISLQQTFTAGPLVTLANMLPISPGGLGVAETAAAVLFGQFGIRNGAAIMLMTRIWSIIPRLPGGIVYIFSSLRKTRQNRAPGIG